MEKEVEMNITKIADEKFKKLKKEEEKVLLLMSNADYIYWLYKHIELYDDSNNDNYTYISTILSGEEKEQFELLPLFYKGISNYANNHYIYPKFCESGEYYKVKFDGIGLQISELHVEESIKYHCKKVVIDDEKKFIDFKDIILENKQERVDQIQESLNGIANSIIEAYENGIPLRSIESTVISSINRVKEKHKVKRRK